MTKGTIFYAILLLSTIFVYTACNKDDNGRNPCLEPKRYFLSLKTAKPADTGTVGVDSVLPSPLVGFVDTNLWFTDGKTANANFSGPLSGVADSVRWFIKPDTINNVRDTLTFYYERKPVFLSTACGYAFAYTLKRIQTTNYLIDSARIEKPDVNSATNITHVKVFY